MKKARWGIVSAAPVHVHATSRHAPNGVDHDVVDSFHDDRRGSGFEFQIEAASDDILDGRNESAIVTHAASLGFQQDMDRVRAAFSG